MNKMNTMPGEAIRVHLDITERYEMLRSHEQELAHKFAGSIRYGKRDGREYLLRRRTKSDKSLGLKSIENDALLRDFQEKKLRLKAARDGLRGEINRRAPIAVAHGLGRVPKMAARILRAIDARGWLGGRLIVVGTNALFAYEAAAGVRISADALATDDVDILLDARRRIRFSALGSAERGLIPLLRKLDRSFEPIQRSGFRASNSAGYIVDLITPQTRDPMRQRAVGLSDDSGDLKSVAIKGLEWLVNAPKFDAVVLDEQGLPARISTIDPRAFALHKLWLSERSDRPANKRLRDRLQAEIAAQIASVNLGLDFTDKDLNALPTAMRAGAALLLATQRKPESPAW